MNHESEDSSFLNIWVKTVSKGAGTISFFILLIMMLLGVAHVIGDLLKHPVPGAAEWTEVLMVFVIFLAIIWVTEEKAHIQVNILDRFLNYSKAGWYTDLIVMILEFLFFGVMAWRLTLGAMYSLKTWEYQEGIIKVYFWPARIAAAVGCILTTIVVVFHLVQFFKNTFKNTTKRTGAD